MKNVGIADLKAHLSDHLQSVRRGETVVVLDRKEPVARIVPIGASEGGLVIRPATRRLQDVPLPQPVPGAPDVVEVLAAERSERLP